MFRKEKLTNKRFTGGERGFSMIEIAVVLLVIAIIAAFVVPQVITYMRMYKLGVASRNVATALQRARFLATSDNRRAGINILEVRRIDIEEYDPEGDKEPRIRGAVILPEGIVIADEAPRQIAFDGRGVVTPLPKESPKIRINGPDGYYAIVSVSPTGHITISDPKRQDI
ncbi:MAG TPA: prepilin-type N-terminal cleavage/methylation domain-containing protein [Blastocatellia bacterium]|jgi:prepilin-type N-terminal cleavage/methylation domain-containing protein|nr:prepilin-type N-terminal cleavage/methylation domain-containing protein [Blastocatellia bacterium]